MGRRRSELPESISLSLVAIQSGRPDLAVQLALRQRHPHAVPGVDIGGASDDARAVRLPAHRIPSPENGERTEHLESARIPAKPGVGKVNASNDGCAERSVGAHELRPDAREPRAGIRRVQLKANLTESAIP